MSSSLTTIGNTTSLSSDSISLTLKIIMGIPMLFGMFPGIFGNLLVIIAITRTRLNRHIVNLLVLSLAFTDILISVFPLPILGVYFVFYWPQWMINGIWCKATIYMVNTCAVVSILTMISIAVDRYFAIKRNQIILSRRVCKILILIIWIISAGIALTSILNGGVIQERLNNGTYSVCNRISGKFITDASIKRSLIIKLVIGFPIVVALIIIYINLSCMVWRRRKLPTDEDQRSTSVRRHTNVKNRAIHMMFAIVVAFAVCWIPYYFVTFMRIVKLTESPDLDPGIVLICYVLVMINSTLNPLLYGLLSRSFRNAFRNILTGTNSRRIRSLKTSEMIARSVKH